MERKYLKAFNFDLSAHELEKYSQRGCMRNKGRQEGGRTYTLWKQKPCMIIMASLWHSRRFFLKEEGAEIRRAVQRHQPGTA